MFNYLNVEKTAEVINNMAVSAKSSAHTVKASHETAEQLNNTLSDKVLDSSAKPTSLAERLRQIVQNRQQDLAVEAAGKKLD